MKKDEILLLIINVNSLNNDVLFKKYYDSLDYERKMKISSLSQRIAKNQKLAANVLLSKGLKRLNISDSIIYNENHKPYLLNNEIYFNISHSYDYAICAFSHNEIGCDIEKIRDFNLEIASKYFKRDEYLDIINSNDQSIMFYKYWTKKESLIKALGLDLFKNINQDFVLETKHLDIIEGYSLAISCQKICNIIYEEIEIEE